MQREGIFIRAKVWLHGESEPEDWQLEVVDADFFEGKVGFTFFDRGSINEWANDGVGTGGMEVPRAPDDLLPKVDKSLLKLTISDIDEEILAESSYTPKSWSDFKEKYDHAEMVLNNNNVSQTEIDQALEDLQTAY